MIRLRKIESLIKKKGCSLSYSLPVGWGSELNANQLGSKIEVIGKREDVVRDYRLKYVLLHELGHALDERGSSKARNYKSVITWIKYNLGLYKKTPKLILEQELTAWRIAYRELKKLNPTSLEMQTFKQVRNEALSGYRKYGK